MSSVVGAARERAVVALEMAGVPEAELPGGLGGEQHLINPSQIQDDPLSTPFLYFYLVNSE